MDIDRHIAPGFERGELVWHTTYRSILTIAYDDVLNIRCGSSVYSMNQYRGRLVLFMHATLLFFYVRLAYSLSALMWPCYCGDCFSAIAQTLFRKVSFLL